MQCLDKMSKNEEKSLLTFSAVWFLIWYICKKLQLFGATQFMILWLIKHDLWHGYRSTKLQNRACYKKKIQNRAKISIIKPIIGKQKSCIDLAKVKFTPVFIFQLWRRPAIDIDIHHKFNGGRSSPCRQRIYERINVISKPIDSGRINQEKRPN